VGPRRERAATRPSNLIELRIPSELGWERAAMDLAGSVARRMGFPSERVEDIRTAVAEATTNAIEHGNRSDASRTVYIELAPEGASLAINVRDSGGAPIEQASGTPSLERKLAGDDRARGWGTFLIKSLVDEVEFTSSGDGNVVRMVIRLEHDEGG
jgi:serine/threonine-protein kinase RsbW